MLDICISFYVSEDQSALSLRAKWSKNILGTLDQVTGLLDPEDEVAEILRNVSNSLPHNTL